MSERRVRPIWSGPRNPPNSVAAELGVPRWRLREILHQIKRRSKLGATDRVTIYDDGTVTDEFGEDVGNIRDEA